MALKKCTTSFVTAGADGKKRLIRAGDLLADSDDVVKRLPGYFVDASVTNEDKTQREKKKSQPSVVEQATAAPGEQRRGPGRPPKARSAEKSRDEEGGD